MRRFLSACAFLAAIFSTGLVAGQERPQQQRPFESAAADQARRFDPAMSGRKVSARRAISATSAFRAEDPIPDICKGCSS
jgi:hypothetical protein